VELAVEATLVRGCGGFGPLAGVAPERAICELQRMYFLPELRGRGAGAALLAHLLGRMQALGYQECYLETTAAMTDAQRLYASFGFTQAAGRLGDAGHQGCELPFHKLLR
jgi:putative acetyltransferase